MGGHIGATWQIWLDRPSAAAMRPYVKLLWPSASEHPLDVAYCYSRCSMVCQFVIVSICHNYDSCKSSWTDHDAVRDVDSGGLNEPCIRWGSRSPMRRGNFEGMTLGFSARSRAPFPVTLTSVLPCIMLSSIPTGQPQKQSSVTLNFPNENPLQYGLSSKF